MRFEKCEAIPEVDELEKTPLLEKCKRINSEFQSLEVRYWVSKPFNLPHFNRDHLEQSIVLHLCTYILIVCIIYTVTGSNVVRIRPHS